MDKIGLIKLTIDGTKTLASRLVFSPPPSEKILDPMSTIIRLAILSYYPPDTKLSIHNNALFLQEPSYLQGPLRWGYSDDREDLHNLHNPISKALDWYDLEIDYVQNIFILAKKGLELLRDCYKGASESNLVCHSLNYYSRLIELKINSCKVDDTSGVLSSATDTTLIDATSNLASMTSMDDAYSELDTNIYNHTGITKLKNFWSYNELKLITNMFAITDEYKLKGETLKYILASINKIVQGKDVKVQELIIKLTTTLKD